MKHSNPELSTREDQGFAEAIANGWLPIREVARHTGVNPVTLRAWERRYGLIVPHRTAKGHRLYSPDHLERIQKVLTWLNRGVSVSQVKALLDAPSERIRQRNENDWLPLRQALLDAIAQLSERRLDDVFNQAMALYPPSTMCEQLLLPLLEELSRRWQGQFGAHLERVFFCSWLRSKLGARIYHNNRQVNGRPLLMINQSEIMLEPDLWLCAWLVSSSDCPVEVFDWPLPAGELALAVDRMQPRAVVLYSSRALAVDGLRKQLQGCACAVLVAGPAVSIHRTELRALSEEAEHLSLATDAFSAHAHLSKANLL